MPETLETAAITIDPLLSAAGVQIEGDGIASACVARLLEEASIPYARDAQPRSKLAAILIGEQTQHLLLELFPPSEASPQDLFAGFTHIARRVVLWGDAATPLDLPHRGVVAPEAELLQRLWQRVPTSSHVRPRESSPPAFRLRSSRASLAQEEEHAFGSRTGYIAQVELRETAHDEICWIESVSQGWLFLLSLGEGRASLIAVGDTVAALLGRSRLIGANVNRVLPESPPLPVYPRLLQTLAGPGWIACGTAAMSFDPLCGEGAGYAVREAFLAAAVLRAALTGANPTLLAEHYTIRLRQGFLRHLQTCLPFYATGGSTGFWQREIASLRSGIDLLQRELSHLPAPRFKLVDRDLMPL